MRSAVVLGLCLLPLGGGALAQAKPASSTVIVYRCTDAGGKQSLKSGQLAWIEKRNKTCSKREPSGFYVNLDCATQTTIERAQFLQDRVRECVSAGCQNSKL